MEAIRNKGKPGPVEGARGLKSDILTGYSRHKQLIRAIEKEDL